MDPLAVLPLPKALPEEIVCATPVARGKRMGDVLPRVARVRSACEKELEKSGPAPSCGALAALLRDGDAVRGDAFLADDLAARACASGVASACTLLAEARLDGIGAPLDGSCAIKVLDYACGRRDLRACARVAHFLDVEPAQATATAACDRGGYEACLWLGEQAGPPGDRTFGEKARAHAERACAAGDGVACRDLASSFERRLTMFRSAHVFVDQKTALALFERGCDLGDTKACLGLYQQDLARAAKACDAGALESCAVLRKVDPTKLEAACALGVDRACMRLLYATSSASLTAACRAGNPVACRHERSHSPEERVDTPEHLRLGCDAGDALSCVDLSRAAREKGDLEGAFALACDACPSISSRIDHRDVRTEGCFDAGVALRDGQGVAKNPGLAALYFRDGCYGPLGESSFDACIALAEMYELGEGVDRSDERASDLYARACSVGREPACDALDRLLGRSPGTSQQTDWVRERTK